LRHVKHDGRALGHDPGMLTDATTSEATEAAPVLSEALLRQFDTPGPRYTSYPTADRFHDRFGAADAEAALRARAQSSAPLSVYVHIPFCESVCYYCACNKVITKHHERAAEYLDALGTELGLVVGLLGTGKPVTQLHFGGGSPTFLGDAELARVMRTLRAAFAIAPTAELSIEVDPRTVTPERLAHLRGLGFNVVEMRNADRFDYAETMIIDYTGKPNTTRYLADLFNVRQGNVLSGSNPDSPYDVKVVLGADAKAP
jgi:hypothetical protein